MCGGGGSSDNGEAAQARQAENARNARISSGMGAVDQQFSQFTDDYYNDYAKKLVDYWRPDINQQAKDANAKLAYTFAGSTPGGSSMQDDALKRLQETRNKSLVEASDNATSKSNELRQNVEGQRSAVISQLNATADPSSAATTAASNAAALSQGPVYSPVGDLFSNLTSQFAVSQRAADAGKPGWGFSIGSDGIKSTSKNGAMKVFS